MSELNPSPADIRMVRYDERDVCIGRHRHARFGKDRAIDPHLPGQHDGACTRSCVGKPAFHNQRIKPYATGH
jgi:hypothetical protein